MLSTLAYGSIGFLAPLMYVLLGLVPVVYLVVRWRTYRESGPADPQLGLKVALFHFRTLGYQIALAGLFCLLYIPFNEEARSDMLRIGGPLLISGLLIYGAHRFFLMKTNQAAFPAVGRLYQGFNLVACGLAGSAALVATLMLLAMEDADARAVMGGMVALLVYGGAWGAQGFSFFRQLKA
jgi:nitrate reductase gamma subunit